ncbi:hypothetical protein cyc_08234 [Cyclospora cayetanensis]|uniref:Uncharacterized protein n=1 Tax=Cyclospora cayetanensis TaxID=88456 RepID=A0A1D3D0G8_9EIME|nr:hypothetical protein cyc_08234 [Cyclospora cayetanensis]
MECLQGSLNQNNQCEIVTAESPKPVCSPGFFESDGFCIRRREVVCDQSSPGIITPEAEGFYHERIVTAPVTPGKTHGSKSFIAHKEGYGSKLHAGLESLREFENENIPWDMVIEVENKLELDPESKDRVAIDRSTYLDVSGRSDGELFLDFPGDMSHLTSYKSSAPMRHDASAEHAFDLQWNPTVEDTELDYNGLSSYFVPKSDVRRRLQRITEQFFDQSASAKQNGTELLKTWDTMTTNANAENSNQTGDALEENPDPKGPPTRAQFGASGFPLGGHPHVDGRAVPAFYRTPLPYLTNDAMAYNIKGGHHHVRQHKHDNRFHHAVTDSRSPLLREAQGLTSDSVTNYSGAVEQALLSGHEQALRDALQRGMGQTINLVDSDATAPHGRTRAEPQIHERSQLAAVARFRSQHKSEGGDYVIYPGKPQGQSSQRGMPYFSNGFTRGIRIAATAELREKQDKLDVHMPEVTQPEDLLTAQSDKRPRHLIRRRLEALDYIPGCWEEDIEMPISWACDANFKLDPVQQVCIRIEYRNPDIICDGQVEGGMCIHVVHKPPQWYCPLDPPPAPMEKDDEYTPTPNEKDSALKKTSTDVSSATEGQQTTRLAGGGRGDTSSNNEEKDHAKRDAGFASLDGRGSARTGVAERRNSALKVQTAGGSSMLDGRRAALQSEKTNDEPASAPLVNGSVSSSNSFSNDSSGRTRAPRPPPHRSNNRLERNSNAGDENATLEEHDSTVGISRASRPERSGENIDRSQRGHSGPADIAVAPVRRSNTALEESTNNTSRVGEAQNFRNQQGSRGTRIAQTQHADNRNSVDNFEPRAEDSLNRLPKASEAAESNLPGSMRQRSQPSGAYGHSKASALQSPPRAAESSTDEDAPSQRGVIDTAGIQQRRRPRGFPTLANRRDERNIEPSGETSDAQQSPRQSRGNGRKPTTSSAEDITAEEERSENSRYQAQEPPASGRQPRARGPQLQSQRAREPPRALESEAGEERSMNKNQDDFEESQHQRRQQQRSGRSLAALVAADDEVKVGVNCSGLETEEKTSAATQQAHGSKVVGTKGKDDNLQPESVTKQSAGSIFQGVLKSNDGTSGRLTTTATHDTEDPGDSISTLYSGSVGGPILQYFTKGSVRRDLVGGADGEQALPSPTFQMNQQKGHGRSSHLWLPPSRNDATEADRNKTFNESSRVQRHLPILALYAAVHAQGEESGTQNMVAVGDTEQSKFFGGADQNRFSTQQVHLGGDSQDKHRNLSQSEPVYLRRQERDVKEGIYARAESGAEHREHHRVNRRLSGTKLPFAYFIMGVNQWRHIHDPVHQLKMDTAVARAAEQAASRLSGVLAEPSSPHHPITGVLGRPTTVGPQLYRHDLKDKKKPTTSPLKIRDTDMCYRQERKKPLVECPPGFTANKEGGCYMIVAPTFTCLAVSLWKLAL